MKKVRDYRKSHLNYEQAVSYENNLYGDGTYDSLIWSLERGILSKEIQAVDSNVKNYLDFACGTGRVTSFVEQYVDNSIAVDISASMLKVASTKVKKTCFINCDLSKDDRLQNKKFEIITAFRFFLNAQQQLKKEVIKLLAGKLSKSGVLIFNIHGNIYSYYAVPMSYKSDILNCMSYFDVKKLVDYANLRIIKTYGIGFFPSSLYQAIKSPKYKMWLLRIDSLLSRLPVIKYFTVNLIFICTHNEVDEFVCN